MTSQKRVALVRRPTPSIVGGLVTHIDRQPVDPELATRQWHAYVEALRNQCWDIVEVAPDDSCPDACFVEDAAVVFGDTAMICRPGHDARRAETGPVSDTLQQLGYKIATIEAPGTLDGGDVMKVGDTVWIGQGGRTNAAGIAQAKQILEAAGAKVIGTPNNKVLHLKSAVTALPDGRVVGYEPAVTNVDVFDSFIAMPEESGAHVVDLGENTLLMAAGCPESAELVRKLGYEPVLVDMSEFEKLEGCVTCLSIRLRSLPENSQH